MKIRISGSKIADQYFRKLGAIPQILAFSEVYQALQTGVVDGWREHAVELSRRRNSTRCRSTSRSR